MLDSTFYLLHTFSFHFSILTPYLIWLESTLKLYYGLASHHHKVTHPENTVLVMWSHPPHTSLFRVMLKILTLTTLVFNNSAILAKAAAVFRRLDNVWRSSTLSLKIKLDLYTSLIISTAIYTSETWKSTARLLEYISSWTSSTIATCGRFWALCGRTTWLIWRC